ncbi:MAG: hypothetical protein PHY36_01140 [Methanocellales archaeon]|nr:hypothetical protein [Methanocellales archaeon]MDD5446478.1 hypothetical protein [Methanocellales archaeon]
MTNGFGYGARFRGVMESSKVIILDVMPNACGMLVGGMNELLGRLIGRTII